MTLLLALGVPQLILLYVCSNWRYIFGCKQDKQ